MAAAECSLPIVSNFWFLIPAGVAYFGYDSVLLTMVYLSIIPASTLHHFCVGYEGLCPINPAIARGWDFFFAQYMIMIFACLAIYFPLRLLNLQRFFLIGSAILVALLLFLVGDSTFVQMGLALGILAIVLTYWTVYYILYQEFPRYRIVFFVPGISCTVLAAQLFITQMQAYELYCYTHANWHTLAAFGQTCLLLMRVPDPKGEYAKIDVKKDFILRSLGILPRASRIHEK